MPPRAPATKRVSSGLAESGGDWVSRRREEKAAANTGVMGEGDQEGAILVLEAASLVWRVHGGRRKQDWAAPRASASDAH